LGIVAALVVFAGVVGYLRTWPPLATVMSASMEPTIKTGDMVVLKRLDRPARVGEIVRIPVPDKARADFGYPPVVIHRIVRIDADGTITTKGDAYKNPDEFTVPRSAVTTKVVTTVPAAGRALAFLGSPLGLLWLVGGGLLLVGMPLLERYRDGHHRDQAERDDLHDVLQTITGELTLLRSDERGLTAPAGETALAAELRALHTALADRDDAAAAERRAIVAASERREAKLAAELRSMAEAAQRREEAMAAELRAVTVSLTKAVEVAERRATTAEEQLRAHLEALPAQIEQAVALALAAHTPPPAPPPPPTRRFVPASQWTSPAMSWDAPAVLATVT
jgi:signal peptidase I